MINWKIRFKNPVFLFQFVLAILSPVLVYTGLSFADITTWNTLGGLFKQAYSNPALLGTMFYAGYNAITDPTTPGIRDSTRSLRKAKPE